MNCPYHRETKLTEVTCSRCDTIDRYCNKCGWGSGHAHNSNDEVIVIQ